MHNAATSTPVQSVSGVFSSKQTNNYYAAPTTTVAGAQSVGVIYFDLGGKGWSHSHSLNSHSHTPGMPANLTVYMWKRTA